MSARVSREQAGARRGQESREWERVCLRQELWEVAEKGGTAHLARLAAIDDLQVRLEVFESLVNGSDVLVFQQPAEVLILQEPHPCTLQGLRQTRQANALTFRRCIGKLGEVLSPMVPFGCIFPHITERRTFVA